MSNFRGAVQLLKTLIVYFTLCVSGVAASSIGVGKPIAKQPISDPMGFVNRFNREKSSAHSLKLIPIGKPKLGEQKSRLSLHNKNNGKAFWAVIVHQIDEMVWSSDHKALAISDSPSPRYQNGAWLPLRLIIWRERGQLLVLEHLPILKDMEFISDLSWSPDNQRLIVLHASSQGSASIGVYRGWCLRIRDRHITKLGLVRKAQWIGPKKVRFQSLRYVPGKEYIQTNLETTVH